MYSSPLLRAWSWRLMSACPALTPAEAAMASWETKPSWPRSVFMSSRTLLAPAWAASASAEPSSTAERGTVTAARRGSPSSGVSSGWEAAGSTATRKSSGSWAGPSF